MIGSWNRIDQLDLSSAEGMKRRERHFGIGDDYVMVGCAMVEPQRRAWAPAVQVVLLQSEAQWMSRIADKIRQVLGL